MKVSELFYSIQGEGEFQGKPAVFLRLQGCNLVCGRPKNDDLTKPCDKCKWVCDTTAVWRQGKEYSNKQLYKKMDEAGCIEPLLHGVHLVITGGEPLMQQESIYQFIKYLHDVGVSPYIEIETNGTIKPDAKMNLQIDRYNVSPKLSNSGNLLMLRYKKEVLMSFINNSKTIFKFVVIDDEDVDELMNDFVKPLNITNNRVYLMPGAYSREELWKNGEPVAELCKKHYFNMSSRLQVEVWDRLTGV